MADLIAYKDYGIVVAGVYAQKGVPIKLHDNGDGSYSESPTTTGNASTRWSYAPPVGGIVNSTVAVQIAAAPGAALKNYLTGLQISSDALGVATEVVINDGHDGTVLWRHKIGTAGDPAGLSITFPQALVSSANNLLEVATLTASVTGGVYVNAQGYVAA